MIEMTKGETAGVMKLLERTPGDGLERVRYVRDYRDDLIVTTVHNEKAGHYRGRRHYYIGPRGRVEECAPPAFVERAPA